ncbi:MAG: nucleotidyltransferase [Lachnospiraceae bacterium]|nr:nucleotidyltransferase [Candidatus Equihabitans merdae]
MKTTLVIMAAGIGSRFGGGIKQLSAMGPNGELIIDYSIHDALEAGFNKVVFIIRKDLEKDFKEIIGDRISKVTEVAYAYQEKEYLPEGFTLPEGRTKPWGTGHALLCAKDVVNEPFAVINADDYYGKEGYRLLHDYLTGNADGEAASHEDAPVQNASAKEEIAMVGFVMAQTLSEHGGVTRGICHLDENGFLTGIDETKNIIKTPEGASVHTEDGDIPLNPDNLVSMNMWGFKPSFFDVLEKGFPEFLSSLEEGDVKSEYLLPIIVDGLLKADATAVSVLKSTDKWFGVTYKEDKDIVKQAFDKLITDGVYKTPLFD